ncbi:Leucine-zipper-like transcriptional regulator 1 [Perkinsus olseni]|uniref:Leucine-zipper-like transcriptional regulator 1 n=1 Tax=Perkinsus olseni TaxID=32597 RepID=A0A7J6MQJ6_PEROL|nr:Leucine-zipper-like transcriptional regulator 1 [Perkinsus olseni]
MSRINDNGSGISIGSAERASVVGMPTVYDEEILRADNNSDIEVTEDTSLLSMEALQPHELQQEALGPPGTSVEELQRGRQRRRRVADTANGGMPFTEELRREEDLPGQWSMITHNSGVPPRARSLHVSVVVDDSMYVFGGYDGSNRVNDFYKYHFPTKAWSTVSYYSPRPSARDRHVAVAYRGNIYIFGGYDGSTRVNDFWLYDTQAQSWALVAHAVIGSSSILPFNYDISCDAPDGKVFLEFIKRALNAEFVHFNVSVLTEKGQVPSARHSHSAVEYNGSMYVFGGYDGNYRNDFHAFNFVAEKWSPVEVNNAGGSGPRARYRTSAVVHKDSMLVFGGHDGSKHLNDFYMFDFFTSTWALVEPSLSSKVPPPTPRDSHIAAVYGDSMYVFGGSTGTARNDLYEFNLITGGWNELRRTSAWRSIGGGNNPDGPAGGEDGMVDHGEVRPCPRFCHTGVVYRGALCVFGGYDGQNRLNDFRRYTLGSEVNVDIPASTLLEDLRGMVDDPTWSDVVFEVEGKKLGNIPHAVSIPTFP